MFCVCSVILESISALNLFLILGFVEGVEGARTTVVADLLRSGNKVTQRHHFLVKVTAVECLAKHNFVDGLYLRHGKRAVEKTECQRFEGYLPTQFF